MEWFYSKNLGSSNFFRIGGRRNSIYRWGFYRCWSFHITNLYLRIHFLLL